MKKILLLVITLLIVFMSSSIFADNKGKIIFVDGRTDKTPMQGIFIMHAHNTVCHQVSIPTTVSLPKELPYGPGTSCSILTSVKIIWSKDKQQVGENSFVVDDNSTCEFTATLLDTNHARISSMCVYSNK